MPRSPIACLTCVARLTLAFALAFVLSVQSLPAQTQDVRLLGGKVEWARLKTEWPKWDRHAKGDPRLLRFIRNTVSMNIDTVWHAADVCDLQQMSAYPFLLSDGIQHVTHPIGILNLREYLKKGGFLFIDSCINTNYNPDPDVFLQAQLTTLQRILPDARIERLPDNHEIYRNCFDMKDGLPHTYMGNRYNPAWAKHGLYAVYSGNRLVSLISLSGLQCGWDSMNPDPEHVTKCMKMMVNIYFYAITH